MNILKIPLLLIRPRKIPKLYPFSCLPGIMINPQWLEPMSRTKLHDPKDARSIEV